jgi:hypothetical protein
VYIKTSHPVQYVDVMYVYIYEVAMSRDSDASGPSLSVDPTMLLLLLLMQESALDSTQKETYVSLCTYPFKSLCVRESERE